MTMLAVALGEYDTGWHDPAGSLRAAERVVGEAARAGAALVVLPEMATTGFTMDAAQAVSLDSAPVEALRNLAREHGVWLVAGVALRERASPGEARVVNAALAIDRRGEIAAVHRKRRMFAFAREDETYTSGDDETIVTIDGARIALFVCYELRFPELFAPVASQVDAMIVIANWPAARRAHWDTLLRARAIECQCVVIGVNRTGDADGIAYDGGSVAYDAWGESLARASLESSAGLVQLDPGAVAEVRRRYPFLRDRRPFSGSRP